MQTNFARLFFAITLNEEHKETLTQLIHSLKTQLNLHHIHWVKPEHFHITIQFIGKTPEQNIPKLITAVREKITELHPFKIHFTKISLFPPKHPHILVLNIKPSPEILTLATKTSEGMMRTGYNPEKRPYLPHLTLGKLKHTVHTSFDFPPIKIAPFDVNQLTLLQSIPTETGSQYIPIETMPLTP